MKMLKFCSIFILFCNLSLISAHERKLSTFVNPNCTLPAVNSSSSGGRHCDDLLLVHIRSEGERDTLHHIWDFSRQPSLMLALTDREAVLRVNWTSYAAADGDAAHSIAFTSKPVYVISVVVAGIIEFNDTDDLGVLDVMNAATDYSRVLSLDGVDWRMVQPMTNDSSTALLAVEGHLATNLTDSNATAANIQISMGAFDGNERASDLPRMLHSANMSQMDIALDHLATTFSRSRFGLSLVVVTSDPAPANANTLKYSEKQNIDDEYTPGVFKMVELLSEGAKQHKFELLDDNNSNNNNVNVTSASSSIQYGGYLQWRPIVYTSPARDATQATRCLHYGVASGENMLQTTGNMLPFKLWGNDSGVLYQLTNVTFGQPEDGFYNKTKFASWTFVVGIGSPAQETLSSFVTHMVLLGIGLPLVLVVLGIVCISVRRLCQNKDDFFLSQ